jgi:hypothetical protein
MRWLAWYRGLLSRMLLKAVLDKPGDNNIKKYMQCDCSFVWFLHQIRTFLGYIIYQIVHPCYLRDFISVCLTLMVVAQRKGFWAPFYKIRLFVATNVFFRSFRAYELLYMCNSISRLNGSDHIGLFHTRFLYKMNINRIGYNFI